MTRVIAGWRPRRVRRPATPPRARARPGRPLVAGRDVRCDGPWSRASCRRRASAAAVALHARRRPAAATRGAPSHGPRCRPSGAGRRHFRVAPDAPARHAAGPTVPGGVTMTSDAIARPRSPRRAGRHDDSVRPGRGPAGQATAAPVALRAETPFSLDEVAAVLRELDRAPGDRRLDLAEAATRPPRPSPTSSTGSARGQLDVGFVGTRAWTSTTSTRSTRCTRRSSSTATSSSEGPREPILDKAGAGASSSSGWTSLGVLPGPLRVPAGRLDAFVTPPTTGAERIATSKSAIAGRRSRRSGRVRSRSSAARPRSARTARRPRSRQCDLRGPPGCTSSPGT